MERQGQQGGAARAAGGRRVGGGGGACPPGGGARGGGQHQHHTRAPVHPPTDTHTPTTCGMPLQMDAVYMLPHCRATHVDGRTCGAGGKSGGGAAGCTGWAGQRRMLSSPRLGRLPRTSQQQHMHQRAASVPKPQRGRHAPTPAPPSPERKQAPFPPSPTPHLAVICGEGVRHQRLLQVRRHLHRRPRVAAVAQVPLGQRRGHLAAAAAQGARGVGWGGLGGSWEAAAAAAAAVGVCNPAGHGRSHCRSAG